MKSTVKWQPERDLTPLTLARVEYVKKHLREEEWSVYRAATWRWFSYEIDVEDQTPLGQPTEEKAQAPSFKDYERACDPSIHAMTLVRLARARGEATGDLWPEAAFLCKGCGKPFVVRGGPVALAVTRGYCIECAVKEEE